MTVSENHGGKVRAVDDVLSSPKQEYFSNTSLDENCIEFEVQTDRNYYFDLTQTYLALKLNFVKARGYKTYKSKEVKKEHKKRQKRMTQQKRRRGSCFSCYPRKHFTLIFFQY